MEGQYWDSGWEMEGFWNEELFPLRRCLLEPEDSEDGAAVMTRCPQSPWGFIERMYGDAVSWLLLGRHWTVPLHYSEHTPRARAPSRPRFRRRTVGI